MQNRILANSDTAADISEVATKNRTLYSVTGHPIFQRVSDSTAKWFTLISVGELLLALDATYFEAYNGNIKIQRASGKEMSESYAKEARQRCE